VDKGGKNDLNAGIALGGLTRGVSPLELTAAYVPFANGGIYLAPTAIAKIIDRDGAVLYEAKTDRRVVMSEAVAFIMTDMLRGVIDRGTGTRAKINRPAAGKTGTTSDYTNAWFVGYTPQLAATVWLGNDSQAKPMTSPGGSIGSAKAAEIWASFMRQALADEPVAQFDKTAPGLSQTVAIDTTNGLRVPDGCNLPPASVRYEVFIEEYAPQTLTPRCN
jgi:penicillin-binding protein 1A